MRARAAWAGTAVGVSDAGSVDIVEEGFDRVLRDEYLVVGRRDTGMGSRLDFKTDARPGKRYLYVHAMLALFRRKRYNVPGWELDRQKVFSGKIWATPGKYVRKSMMRTVAIEFGDSDGEDRDDEMEKDAAKTHQNYR